MTPPMNSPTLTAGEIAEKLTEAQRQYLIVLEPNTELVEQPMWRREVHRQFQNRSFRKEIKRPGLDTANVLIRKGIVCHRPEPVECGFHYASLTPLGLAVRQHLLESPSNG